MNFTQSSIAVQNNGPTLAPLPAYENLTIVRISAICGGVLAVIGTLINLELLVTFIRQPSLIGPFPIHILNLTLVNLFTAIGNEPLHIVHDYNRDLFQGNRDLCSAYKYFQWISASMIALQHCVICFDRWMALLFPQWYRNKPVKFGVLLTVGVIVYQHAWYLPLFITDRMIPIGPDDFCAHTRAFPLYQQISKIAILYVPQGLTFFSYPILLCKVFAKRVRRKILPAQLAPSSQRAGARSSISTRKSANLVADSEAETTAARSKYKSDRYLVVWILVIQVTFWAPSTIMTAVLANMTNPFRFASVAMAVVYMLPNFLLVLDPLAFIAFQPALRKVVLRHVKSVSKRFRQFL